MRARARACALHQLCCNGSVDLRMTGTRVDTCRCISLIYRTVAAFILSQLCRELALVINPHPVFQKIRLDYTSTHRSSDDAKTTNPVRDVQNKIYCIRKKKKRRKNFALKELSLVQNDPLPPLFPFLSLVAAIYIYKKTPLSSPF